MNESILNDREERYLYIQELSKTYHNLIVLKANTPGPDKNRYSSLFLIKQLNQVVERRFSISFKILKNSFDGPYYVYAISNDISKDVKLKLINIENSHPLGRYIDLDLYVNSKMISREDFNIGLRNCMLCNHSAIDCMRNDRHTKEEILSHIDTHLSAFLTSNIKKFIEQSMLSELKLEQKFGLVTPTSSGSHDDMNYTMMLESINVLLPYFIEIFELGFLSDYDKDPFQEANRIGLKAEEAMFKQTHKVNTYKGLIYILGFVLLALGQNIKDPGGAHLGLIRIKELSSNVLDDFTKKTSSSGIDAYKKYHITGIRGEVFHGLPTIVNALDYFDKIDISDPKNFHAALLYFIIHCEDTVLLKRSKSLDNYNHIKYLAAKINPYDSKNISDFNNYCISHHISFGGSADLFIILQFINYIRTFIQ